MWTCPKLWVRKPSVLESQDSKSWIVSESHFSWPTAVSATAKCDNTTLGQTAYVYEHFILVSTWCYNITKTHQMNKITRKADHLERFSPPVVSNFTFSVISISTTSFLSTLTSDSGEDNAARNPTNTSAKPRT